MSLYLAKGTSQRVQPWIHTLGVGRDIFDLYESKGDVVSTASINIPSVQDGPGVVVRYNNLTLNHVLSTTNRCHSLTILVDGDLIINNGGGISMTARGARGHAGMGLYDGYIPASIDLASKHLLLADVLQYVKDNSIDVTDRWFWDDFARTMGVTATFNQGGALVLLTASGCGNFVESPNGQAGNAGTNGGTGAGGVGGTGYGNGRSCPGRPWGGGGGGGSCEGGFSVSSDPYCGYGGNARGSTNNGGGAGNPGGTPSGTGTAGQDGTGGILRIIVKGTITINSGGIIQADGVNGGNGIGSASGSGGGSGGGHVSIITLGTFTNNGTVRANGGIAGTCTTYFGGAGGVGSVVTKTFAQMGW